MRPGESRMAFRAGALVNKPMYRLDDLSALGFVFAYLVRPDGRTVDAVVIGNGLLVPKSKVKFSLIGIEEGIVVADTAGKSLLLVNWQARRAYKTWKTAPYPAAIEKGDKVGKVVDHVIDEHGAVLALIVEKRMFGKEYRVSIDSLQAVKDGAYVLKPGSTSRDTEKPLLDDITVGVARQLAFATNKTREFMAKRKKAKQS